MKLIAICGGIGSGKTVVSRMLAELGYAVFDCDHEAKRLMDASDDIKLAIAQRISPRAINGNAIDRRALAEIVFGDKAKLNELNAIVHGEVKTLLRSWFNAQQSGKGACFVETAILNESGMDRMVDEVWEVTAPQDVRVARVMRRNGCPRRDVEARIEAQRQGTPNHHSVKTIVNDGHAAVLPQLLALLEQN